MKKLLTSFALAASALTAQAAPVSIGFEGLPVGTAANPLSISGASFSTLNGFNVIGNSLSNWLCSSTTDGSVANCSATLEVAFDSAVSGLSFDFRFNNTIAVGADIGDIEVYAGATLLGTADMLVQDDDSFTFDSVSLAGFANITRIVVSSVDAGGVGYDNFRFDDGTPGTRVPEPASWALVLAAVGLAGAASRRRRAG